MKKFLGKLKAFAFARKKRFYILLTIVFSLILLLDIGVGVLLPSQTMSFGMTQDFSDFSTDTTFPGTDSTDTDTADADTDSTDTDTTGDSTDTSGMPDMSEMPSGGSMPGSTDSSDSTDAADTAESTDSADTSSDEDSTDSTDSSDTADTTDSTSSDESVSADSTTETASAADGTDVSGEMPSGDFSGEMPSGDASGDMTFPGTDSTDTDSTDADTDTESTDTDTTDTGSTDTTASVSGTMRVFAALQVIKSHWILIAIIAAILDACSIAMLILLRRKQKAAEALEEQLLMEALIEGDGEVHLARPKQKKKHMSTTAWIVVIAAFIVLILVVKFFLGQVGTETSETEATTYEETVETGSISTTLPGAGTLTEEDAVEVTLPSEVEILEWYVSNGDTVEEGDILALVDTDSALQAIASVQELLDTLDEELASVEEEDTDGTLTATAAGRVKAIYAASGDDVIDVMYESGSLIVLSLDGLMAVSFETETAVTVGDSVTVTLSDGTEEDGTVESSVNGTVVVTLTDYGTTLGDSVTVTDADGTLLGTGELYVHSALKMMAFSGTVSSVSVSLDEKVSSGDTLLSLTDIDNTLEVQLLVEQRTELEDTMDTLFTLYQEGYLYAESAGVVSGLSTSSSSSSSDSDDSDTESTDDDSSDTSDSSTDTTATETDTTSSAGSSVITASAEENAGTVISTTMTAAGGVLTANVYESAGSTDAGEGEEAICISLTTLSASTSSAITLSASALTDSTEESDSSTDSETDSSYENYLGVVTDITDDTVSAALFSITGGISTDSTEGIFTLSSTNIYTWTDGTLTSISGEELAVGDSLIIICSADASAEDLAPICVICISESASASSGEDTSGEQDASGSDAQEGTDASGETSADSTDTSAEGSLEDMMSAADSTDSTDSADAASALAAAAATSGDTTTDTSAAEEAVTETLTETVSTSYSVSETTWLSITPQDSMYITITIDELDILSLAVGLEAEVTLDAFPGQSFTGVVESIDLSGTNSGGNSKYTAVVKIDREDDMLAGMNASVKITLETTEDVLCIPVNALVEDETGTYVYTSYDESTDTLGDLVEVETGISDGENVEIVSGLSEGDTYYYSILDTVNVSSSTVTSGGTTFNFSSFGGGF